MRVLLRTVMLGGAEFLVDGMGYLTALVRTSLSGNLNYSERNIVNALVKYVVGGKTSGDFLITVTDLWSESDCHVHC